MWDQKNSGLRVPRPRKKTKRDVIEREEGIPHRQQTENTVQYTSIQDLLDLTKF